MVFNKLATLVINNNINVTGVHYEEVGVIKFKPLLQLNMIIVKISKLNTCLLETLERVQKFEIFCLLVKLKILSLTSPIATKI